VPTTIPRNRPASHHRRFRPPPCQHCAPMLAAQGPRPRFRGIAGSNVTASAAVRQPAGRDSAESPDRSSSCHQGHRNRSPRWEFRSGTARTRADPHEAGDAGAALVRGPRRCSSASIGKGWRVGRDAAHRASRRDLRRLDWSDPALSSQDGAHCPVSRSSSVPSCAG
jgi:hypothetical protein